MCERKTINDDSMQYCGGGGIDRFGLDGKVLVGHVDC
mgnify:CR=1 FL=1